MCLSLREATRVMTADTDRTDQRNTSSAVAVPAAQDMNISGHSVANGCPKHRVEDTPGISKHTEGKDASDPTAEAPVATSGAHEDTEVLPTKHEDTSAPPSGNASVSNAAAETVRHADAPAPAQVPAVPTESTCDTPTKSVLSAVPTLPSPETPTDTLTPTCWICYDSTSTEDSPLVRTCKCKGSVEHVHEACLLEWLSASESDSCVHCQHKYSLDVSYPSKTQQLLDHQNVPVAIAITIVLAVVCLFHRMFMWTKTRLSAAAQTFWAKRTGGAAAAISTGRPSPFGVSQLSPDMMTMMVSSLVPGGRMLMPVIMSGFGGQPAPRSIATRVPFLGLVEPGMLFVEMQLFVLLLVGGFVFLSWVRTKMPARETRRSRQWSPLVAPLLWCADAVDRCVDTVQQQWQSADTPVWTEWQEDSMQMPQVNVLHVFYGAVLQGARSFHAGFVNKTRCIRPYDDVAGTAQANPTTPSPQATSAPTS